MRSEGNDGVVDNVAALVVNVLPAMRKWCWSAWPDFCCSGFFNGRMVGRATLQAHLASSYDATYFMFLMPQC